MPRTLPWLVEMTKKSSEKPSTTTSSTWRKRSSSPEDLVDDDLNVTKTKAPSSRPLIRPVRTPSTSPPPAPPDVEFMKEGFDEDDGWIMVEDEFFSIAQSFTKHIHHAEYVRLKKLAKNRGNETLRTIARPTDGRTEKSAGQRLRQAASDNERNVMGVIKKVSGREQLSDSEEELDPQLTGLMAGSQRTAEDLSSLVRPKANTRAAAGFDRSPRKAGKDEARHKFDRIDKGKTPKMEHSDDVNESNETEDEESDDLDAVPTQKSTSASYSKPSTLPMGLDRERPRTCKDFEANAKNPRTDRSDRLTNPVAQVSSKYADERYRPAAHKFKRPESPEATNVEFSSSPPTIKVEEPEPYTSTFSGSNYLAKRKLARTRKEQDEGSKDKSSVDIPLWIG